MAGQENRHIASWRGWGESESGVALKMMYHFPEMLWISGAQSWKGEVVSILCFNKRERVVYKELKLQNEHQSPTARRYLDLD